MNDARPRSGPLAGLKVVDLTVALMGPYCTQILADLGADVIKVESADGDTTRFLPPGHHLDRGGIFLNLNRGKRGIVADLKQPEGRDLVLRLAATADLFVHSIRLPAVERLRLAYADVAAVNPSVVYLNLTGFDRRGPYADLPAYDDVIQAASGMVMLQGALTGGEPSLLSQVVADKVAGLTGLYAALAALHHRQRTGEGQEVDVTMFETLTSFVMVEHLTGSLFDPPLGPPGYARVLSRDRRPYKTKDGYLCVMIYNDGHWRRFFAALGDPEWSSDPRFASIYARTEHIDFVLGTVSEILAQRTTEEWIDLFRKAEVPAMPLYTVEDLLTNEHLDAVGFWETHDTADGALRYPGIPTQFSKTPGRITNPAPALGGDTRTVLAEYGYSDAEVDDLLERGVVQQHRDPRGK